MKKIKIVIAALFFLEGFFVLQNLCLAEKTKPVINEIMYEPKGSNSGHSDWIELFNFGDEDIEISKSDFGIIDEETLELGKDGIHYLNCHKVAEDIEIEKDGYLILAKDKDDFENDYPDFSGKAIDTTFDLSSHGDTIRLSRDKCATFFEEISYDDDWGADDNGKTLERIDPEKENNRENWQESYVDGGTPGEKNSLKPDPIEYSHKVRLNEILPNPENEDNEFIEIYNFSGKDIELSSWALKDASKTGRYELPKDSEIKSNSFLVIKKSEYRFSLNNSGDESVTLVDPNGEIVSEVKYSGSKEEISYNFTGKIWRWSKYLTPGKPNRFNNLPQVKVKKDNNIYQNMYAEFSAEVKDPDKDEIKVTWDFGDGHRSYLQETRHKYEKTGKYLVKLKVTDGSEDVWREFKIEVKKYPEYDIELFTLCPNPAGSDTENEWLVLKNEEDEDVNLKNWSIATGSENLYNHPIYEDLEIEANEVRVIKRDECKFTLHNQRSKIELRYPNGKVADDVEYKREKSAAEDEIYQKTEDGWIWILPQTAEVSAIEPAMAQVLGEEVAGDEFLYLWGGQSFWEKKNYRLIFMKLALKANLAEMITSPNSRIFLGKMIQGENERLLFVRAVPTDHYAVNFLKSLLAKINFSINQIILGTKQL